MCLMRTEQCAHVFLFIGLKIGQCCACMCVAVVCGWYVRGLNSMCSVE